jgi:hypothetical protein
MIHRSQLFNSNDGSRSNRRLNCLATLVLSSSLSSITTTTAAALVPTVTEQHSSSSNSISHGTFDNKEYNHPNNKQRLRHSNTTTKAVRSEEKLQPATLDYPRVANNAKRRRGLKADDNLQQQQQQQQLQVLKTAATSNSNNNTSSYEYVSGVMFDSKARKDSNIVLHSLVLYTTPPPSTPTIANNVTNTNIIVKLYIRHGSYVGYENDITAGSGSGSGGWTRQHVKITSMATAANNTNEITVAFVEPIYIRKKQIVAFYITTTTAATSSNRDNVEKDENESMIQVTTITDKHGSRMMEGEPYSWNTDLIVNVGIGISSSSSSSLVNSSPRSNNDDDACVWNGELLYRVVDDDDMPTTETPTNQPTITTPTIFITDLTTTKESRANNNNDNDYDYDNQFSSFRLRLYWEVGYYWQETYDETYWCMECGDNTCTLGNEIYIEWCATDGSRNNNNQQWLLVGNAARSTIRPVVDTNLCITVIGYDEGNPLRLYNCNDNDDDNNTNQLFSIVGLPTTAASTTRNNDNDNDNNDHNDDKFEIKPINNNNLCISQMHHPKKMERLYPEDCISAHNDDTGYWITF